MIGKSTSKCPCGKRHRQPSFRLPPGPVYAGPLPPRLEDRMQILGNAWLDSFVGQVQPWQRRAFDVGMHNATPVGDFRIRQMEWGMDNNPSAALHANTAALLAATPVVDNHDWGAAIPDGVVRSWAEQSAARDEFIARTLRRG